MAKVRVSRANAKEAAVEVETGPAFSLLTSLMRSGLRVRHDCGGKALCGTCRLRVLSGEAGLSPMQSREAQRLAASGFPQDERASGQTVRLACQTHVFRDAEIELLLD